MCWTLTILIHHHSLTRMAMVLWSNGISGTHGHCPSSWHFLMGTIISELKRRKCPFSLEQPLRFWFFSMKVLFPVAAPVLMNTRLQCSSCRITELLQTKLCYCLTWLVKLCVTLLAYPSVIQMCVFALEMTLLGLQWHAIPFSRVIWHWFSECL